MKTLMLLLTEEDRLAPYDERGCYQSKGHKMFENCAWCNHKLIDWSPCKKKKERENKKLTTEYRRHLQAWEEKKRDNEKEGNKPRLILQDFLIRCNCHKFTFSHYNNRCPYCSDGSCNICKCGCGFVCKVSDSSIVRGARHNKKLSDRICSRVRQDTAKAFLLHGSEVRSTSKEEFEDMYASQVREGKLTLNESKMKHAIAHQSTLVVANHYLAVPPQQKARS